MKHINLLIIAVAALFLTSCGNVKDISIGDIKQAKLKSMQGSILVIEIEAEVHNPSAHKLILKKGEFEVERNGFSFAEAKLRDKVIIPARSSTSHSMFLEINVLDMLTMVFAGAGNFDKLVNELTLTGYLKGGTSLLSKKYKFKNVKMSELKKVMKE